MNTLSPLAVHRISADFRMHQPLVLLHGFASSAAADFLDPGWASDFADRDLLMIDLPGHGESPDVPSAADGMTGEVVAAIIAAIRETATRSVDVLGYSLGARLAWELPAAAPGLVRRLVLGGLSPFEPFGAVDFAALRAAVDPAVEVPATAADPLTGMIAGMISTPGLRSRSLANLVGGLAAEPFEPSRAAPAVPTLLVAGSDDRMSEGAEGLASLLPDARLLRVPGDHRGALDSPELRAAARDFLS